MAKMTRSSPEAIGGIALLAAALFGLLAVSERAGLPLNWVKILLCVLVTLVFMLVITIGRTTRERLFFGVEAATHPVPGGLTVGLVAALAMDALSRPANGAGWLAVMMGTVAGFFCAQILARSVRRQNRQSENPDLGPGQISAAADPLRGFAMLILGATVFLSTMGIASDEIARLFGLSAGAAICLALLIVVMPTLAGGGQSATMTSVAFSATALAMIALLLISAMISLGPLPLPGQSDAGTLEAIEAARASWRIERPLHFKLWPSPGEALSGANLRLFAFAAVTSGGLLLASSPFIPAARRTTAFISIVTAVALPVALIALGGYAIETAAVRFIGAPIAKPPTSLIEASQLGLVSACGAKLSTAEAIRTACGVSPRDTAVFTWDQIRLTSAYVESGFAAALGFSGAFSIAISAMKLLMTLGVCALGLWIGAKGLGRDLLARDNTAAGLASLRLGQTRLASVIIAMTALLVHWFGYLPPLEFLVAAATGGAFLMWVATAIQLRRRPGSIAPTPPSPSRKRRIKAAPPPTSPPTSPQGEAA